MADEKRAKGPEFSCDVFPDGVSFRLELDFDASFEQSGLRLRFSNLLDADLEQLEMNLKRHLETVRKMRHFSRNSVRILPEKLLEGT